MGRVKEELWAPDEAARAAYMPSDREVADATLQSAQCAYADAVTQRAYVEAIEAPVVHGYLGPTQVEAVTSVLQLIGRELVLHRTGPLRFRVAPTAEGQARLGAARAVEAAAAAATQEARATVERLRAAETLPALAPAGTPATLDTVLGEILAAMPTAASPDLQEAA